MARSFREIQLEILNAKWEAAELSALEVLTENEQNTLPNLTSTSKVAIWRLWVYIMAVAQWIQEKLWDVFRKEVEERIAETRVHTQEWYRQEGLKFQFGHELVWNGNHFVYETVDEIAQIIKHIAVQKYIINGYGVLRIKVATEQNGERIPLNAEQLTAFKAYMNKVADAGTVVIPTTGVADDLKLQITIAYDPLVLDNTGARLDNTDDAPVITRIKEFLKSFEFNGELVLQKLQNALEEVQGVEIPYTTDFNAWSKFGSHSYEANGVLNAGRIEEIRVADSGYMKLDEEQTEITYIPIDE